MARRFVHGRLIARALAGALAALAVTASSALAAKPTHTKIEDFVVTFPAGVVCEFAVEWDIDTLNNNQIVFPERANGDVVTRQNGTNIVTVTNLDTGDSISLRGGFRLDVIAHADGTFEIVGTGAILAGYFPTDVPGRSMWLFRGRLHDATDTAFNTVAHSFSGNSIDLCAALSD